MTDQAQRSPESIDVDLRNPYLAAFLGWLVPGAGHIYQRRYPKGVLFLVTILATYFFGLSLGGGHCVYAQWQRYGRRWQYACQFPVGAAALPALLQSHRISKGQPPLFGGWMARPLDHSTQFADGYDELSRWHDQYHAYFELGTMFTMVAGLLNLLAICDAFGGPMLVADGKSDKPPPDESKSPPAKPT